jgi:hypothetical protein
MKTAYEAANEALVRKVVTALFNDHDASALDRYFTESLIQHNPRLLTAPTRCAPGPPPRTGTPRSAWSPPTATS